jgi:ATP-dependent Lhr-like helicase
MIYKADKQYEKDFVLSLLDPIIQEWFEGKFTNLTPPQAFALPLIHDRKNVLIASPTGSGKTLTAFLTLINELFILGKNDRLENRVYCVYISPLKALANDIERNLNMPLKEIYELAGEKGITLPEIRVGVRSGDTSPYDKQKMVKNPPHILITTPETLSIVLSTTRFRENLRNVEYVIVDEIHEVCSSKRGVHLSVSLERLQYLVSSEANEIAPPASEEQKLDAGSTELTRIGLSATQAPINEIAKFLVGYNGKNLRDVHIIQALYGKQLNLSVLCPVQDMNLVPFEIVNSKMYQKLREMIDSHRTTLVFTNTRSGTEAVVFKLHERGINNIAAHHGSLSKEIRLDVEQKLKNGELDATITSTSLELGIDIGYIDLVCQIGSPKSIAKGLQRIGRAGHALHEVSKGRLIVFDRDDLVECSVLVKSAYDGFIDRINIPKNSLDVLAQTVIGMSLEQRWNENMAFHLIRNSYSFHKLPKSVFRDVLAFIGGHHSLEGSGVYGKIWYDPGDKAFGIRRGSRLIYNLNIGTIPQESSYKVILFGPGMALGSLSEKFVERLTKGDVFILGGKTYEFIQCKGMKVFVKDAHGRKPTVPSWSGEMLPRSFDLSCAIGRFRGMLDDKLKRSNGDIEKVMKWLSEEYYIDEGSARSIVNYLIEQQNINPTFPTDKHVVIEGYIDARGYKNLIFHYCFGRRVNDALSRAYAYALSKKYNCTVRISLTDDNFMLTLPKRVELSNIERLVTPENLVDILRRAIRHTELFKQRFRHCAVRSFMILRNYKGRDISIRKQHYRAQRVLDVLNDEAFQSTKAERKSSKVIRKVVEIPVLTETYNEILHEAMDINNATAVIKDLRSGKISLSYAPYSNIPSPFAHNIVLMGISDIVLMEDRSALLRELHKQVLAKVVSKQELATSKFDIQQVESYFARKVPKVQSKKAVVQLIEKIGPLRLFVEKGKNIFNYSSVPRRTLLKWSRELVNDGVLTSILRNDLLWIPAAELPNYFAVYGKPFRLSKTMTALTNAVVDKTLPDKLDSRQKDDIRKMEKHFILYRNKVKSYGVHHYALRDLKSLKKAAPPFDVGLDNLILKHLEYHGVNTVAEVAYDLAIDEELCQKVLRELEDRNMVTSGNFVLGKDLPQFMLLKDMLKLELISKESEKEGSGTGGTKKELIMDESDFLKFVEKREFKPLASIQKFFDKYLVAFNERDIFLRMKNFELGNWRKLLSEGEVIQGRFQSGRVCYIRRQDITPLISLYRQADLGPLEIQVLDYIKSKVSTQHELYNQNTNSSFKHEGVTRSELISALKFKENDIIDAIEKLDYNLYIARSKRNIREFGVLNRYIPIDIDNLQENCAEVVLTRLIKGYGPIPFVAIKGLMHLPGEFLKELLQDLIDRDVIFKFVVISDVPMEVYAPTQLRNTLMRFNTAQAKNAHSPAKKYQPKLRILSQTDPFIRRFEMQIRNKFGDDWSAAIMEGARPRGVIQLWKLASCIEIRNILFDPEYSENEKAEVLASTLNELDELMKFYDMMGIDILKIKTIENLQVSELSAQTKAILKDNGYNSIQDAYVKGSVLLATFKESEIMNYILHRQHVHPQRRFDDPMEVIQTFGGLRSDFELHLRLNGRSYDLKEYRSHHGLAAGQMIPEFFMYSTVGDAQLYKTAKGKELDEIMEYVLSHIPGEVPIKPQELKDRVNLSDPSFKTTVKRLYDGLFITRTPFNYYQKLSSLPSLSRAQARRLVVRRIIENFGIFTAEGLASYLKREFSMEEIRALLREFEQDGILAKGYLVEGRGDLFWIVKGAEKNLKKLPKMRERFVLSPQDQLSYYLIENIRERFKMGSCYVLFNGTEMTGAFKASKRGEKFIVSDFVGDDEDWATLRMFGQKHRLDLIEKDQEDLYNYDEKIVV